MDADEWKSKLGENVYRGLMIFGEPMTRHTTLGIGGDAEAWLVPSDPLSLGNVLAVAMEERTPVTVVGGGSNLLVLDGGVPGVLLSTGGLGRVERIGEDDASVEVFAEAGVGLGRLLSLCGEWGLGGVEGLAGIPGTIGGAIRMNAGSYGDEISSVVESIALMTPEGKLYRLGAEQVTFGYRASSLPDNHVIMSANLRFRKDDPAAVVAKIRSWTEKKKADQPIAARSAGSVFKNPPARAAWKLVDEAGFRGAREGGIRVSEKHANFFVNEGGGTAADFLRLAERVSVAVQERHGIELEMEVRVIGVPA